MSTQISEVSVKFRAAYVFAGVTALALWPFGLAYGVAGAIFGVGLLILTSILSMPRSIDLMFGMMVSLMMFAAQFLGAVFVGIELGASVTPMVLSCVVLWFLQLAFFGWDLNRYSNAVVTSIPGRQERPRQDPDSGDDDPRGFGSGSGPVHSPDLAPELPPADRAPAG